MTGTLLHFKVSLAFGEGGLLLLFTCLSPAWKLLRMLSWLAKGLSVHLSQPPHIPVLGCTCLHVFLFPKGRVFWIRMSPEGGAFENLVPRWWRCVGIIKPCWRNPRWALRIYTFASHPTSSLSSQLPAHALPATCYHASMPG